MRHIADAHVQMRRVLSELREAVLEQVGKDQTDRLRHALADAVNAYRRESNDQRVRIVRGTVRPRRP